MGCGQLVETIADPHLDAGQVEVVIAQLDPVPHQDRVHLVAVAFQGDGGRLAYQPFGTGEEQVGQRLGVGRRGWPAPVTPVRGFSGLRVGALVVVLLQPGPEETVQVLQAGEVPTGNERPGFGIELLLDGADQPFDLPAPGRLPAAAQDYLDAQ